MEPGPHTIGPGEGYREQSNKLGDTLFIFQMRRFKVESAAFEGGKEGFDLPSFAVEGHSSMSQFTTDKNDHIVPVTWPNRTDIEPVPADDASLSKGEYFSWSQMRKDMLSANASPFAGADIEKAAHSDNKTNVSFFEIGKPCLAYKLPVGNQASNRARIENLEEFVEQIDPCLRIGASFFGQHAPQEWDSNTVCTSGNHKYIMVAPAEAPHRAIERQNKRFSLGQQRQHQCREGLCVNSKTIKKALQTTIVRCHPNRWIQHKSQLGKIDASHLEKSNHKASREVNTGLMPGKMLLQKLLQSRRMIHDLIDGLVWKFCRNQNTTLFNQIFFLSCTKGSKFKVQSSARPIL